MKKKPFLAIATFTVIIISIGFYIKKTTPSAREQYEAKIMAKANEFSGRYTGMDGTLKAPDRPDEAAFYEYMITMDPTLGYVPRERLVEANRNTMEIMRNRTAGQDYDPNITWELTGSNMGGRTRTLLFDPNDPSHNKVWAGGVTGGLWYTNDITDTDEEWVPVADMWSNMAISCMAYDPNNTETFYVGTGEAQTARIIYRESSGLGTGIFKSSDAGLTWHLLDSTMAFAYITDIVVRDEDGISVIYAAVASGTYMGTDHESQPNDGLYRSDDGGSNWEQVLPEIPGFTGDPYTPADIELAANGRLFVGTMENLNGLGGATILWSDDGKPGTWNIYDYYNTKISGESYYKIPSRTIVASAPSNPNKVYAQFAAGYDASDFRRYRGRYMAVSVDGGNNWDQINKPDNDWSTLAWHAFILKVDPSDENTIYTGGLDLWRSANSGSSWNHVSDWSLMYWGGGDEYVHADQHNIQYKPGSPETTIFSSDGGVFLTNTSDQGYPVFIERNQGYGTLQFYSCAMSPTPGAKKYIGGLQDNGTLYYKGSPLDLYDMIDGGDGAYCFWDQNESGIFLTSVYYNRYTSWSNGNDADYIDGESGTFISPADYDYRENILYSNAVGFTGSDKDRLLKIDGIPFNLNGQMVYLGTGSDVPFSHVSYSRYSPVGTSTLFVGTQSGRLFKVTNAQALPVVDEIGSSDFPTANLSCVAIGDNEDQLLVTFSNYGVSSVWLTVDGGTTWEEKESNLPDIPVRWALFHPDNPGQAMLATETGIWVTNTLLEPETEWVPANDGLANVRVDMLRIRPADNTVLAATHGRGLATTTYELDVYTGVEEAEMSVDNILVYPNPAESFIRVSATGLVEGRTFITVSDLSGKQLNVLEANQTSSSVDETIDVSSLSKGVYIVTVKTGNLAFSRKLIIE